MFDHLLLCVYQINLCVDVQAQLQGALEAMEALRLREGEARESRA